MTPAGALAVTGGVLLLVAIVAGVAAEDARSRTPLVLACLALLATCSCFIGAAWWEALS